MSGWTAKRFWKTAQPITLDQGFGVALDDRRVSTPARAPLIVPTHAMATAIAAEWDAQTGKIDPRTMPVTRGANAAIDKVIPQRAEVVAMLADYGDSDLLCYRAAEPEGLVARQKAGWDPLLDWVAQTYDAPLQTRTGVIHAPQAAASRQKLAAVVNSFDAFSLAGLYDLISLSGSLVLGLAVVARQIDADSGWRLSRIDEHWQIEKWGADDEAAATEIVKHAAFVAAARFCILSRIDA